MFVNSKIVALVLGLSPGAWGQGMDAALSDVEGREVRLARAWGRPAVVFYEDKDSTTQNKALKDELFRLGKQRGLLSAASVIAIANVRGFDWFPAKTFVTRAVRDTQKSAGIPVYLDWKGALSKEPWGLRPDGSTVMVVDPQGARVFSKTGRLSREDIARVLALLAAMVERG